MQKIDKDIYYVIGMSPGNSYFKEDEIKYLLKTTVERYGRVLVMIADIPAISTYIALGYPQNRARRDKALPQGNLLKNRTERAILDLGYKSNQVRIVDWEKEVENNKEYKKSYSYINSIYESNISFEQDADETTKGVIIGSKKEIPGIAIATKIAVHYLLSEFAFMDFLPNFLGVKKVVYIYHKNWPIYENYIAGKYDNKPKPHEDFLLLENPWETYNPIWGLEENEDEAKYLNDLDRVEKTKILRVSFSNYPPALIYDKEYNNFSGIFYEIIIAISRKFGWKVLFSEEVGYGVIIDGLNSNRFDIFGSTVWPTPERKEQASFSLSLYKSSVFAWARESNDVIDIFSSRIVIKENDISDSIALADYPKARLVHIPQLSESIDLLKFVTSDKGDITFVEPYLAEYFNKSSEIKVIKTSENPIREYENTFMFKKNDTSLRDLFNKEIEKIKGSGFIKELIKKYTGSEDTFKLD